MQPVTCRIQREVDVYVAMSRGREVSSHIGFGSTDRARIEIVILELTRNLIVHAGGGEITISPVEDPQRGPGIRIESRDTGPGIADISLAMQDGYSTASTLGSGLPGVQRLMDDFTIESTVGEGTWVSATKWLKPSRRSIYGH